VTRNRNDSQLSDTLRSSAKRVLKEIANLDADEFLQEDDEVLVQHALAKFHLDPIVVRWDGMTRGPTRETTVRVRPALFA
jgi:hypothetical protein